MTPAEKRAAATAKRVEATQLIREAQRLDQEAHVEDILARHDASAEG
jgi:hypothetical protein